MSIIDKLFNRSKAPIPEGELMITKRNLVDNQIIIGTNLLVRVGHLFRTEVIQVIVKDKSPNGEYVKFGDGIEWFSIKSLKIMDILKA